MTPRTLDAKQCAYVLDFLENWAWMASEGGNGPGQLPETAYAGLAELLSMLKHSMHAMADTPAHTATEEGAVCVPPI